MLSSTRDLLTHEATNWHQQGLIERPLLDTLLVRYERRDRFIAGLLKWLGLFAIFQLGLAVFAYIALLSESAWVGAIMLGITAVISWCFGIQSATSPYQKNPLTGSILVTASLTAVFGTFVLIHLALEGEISGQIVPTTMLLTSALGLFTAYRYHLRWPLLLALLLFFHGLGVWHAYGGYGSYFITIHDERIMAMVALLAIILGCWHERYLENKLLWRYNSFGSLYLILGLLYLNLSLWFLTLFNKPLGWILIFTATSITQIVIGAWLHDSRFTGFGIVFLAINLYTRYFEHFWNQLSLGGFLCIGGMMMLVLGFFCEYFGHNKTESQLS